LIYAHEFNHAFLEPHLQTQSATHNYQEILYVVKGQGCVMGGGKKAPIENSTAILIPPNMEHILSNDGSEPMESLRCHI
jgi:mannose-6-phosphate isomerase-like protein (cupin superfamily)